MDRVNCSNSNGNLRPRRGRNQINQMGRPNLQNPNQRQIETWESCREEPRGDGRAEERASLPSVGQTLGVIGVEMSEEIGLALFIPPIHRNQTFLHIWCLLCLEWQNPIGLCLLLWLWLWESLATERNGVLKWDLAGGIWFLSACVMISLHFLGSEEWHSENFKFF